MVAGIELAHRVVIRTGTAAYVHIIRGNFRIAKDGLWGGLPMRRSYEEQGRHDRAQCKNKASTREIGNHGTSCLIGAVDCHE